VNTITLVRHGETEWSRAGKHTGRTDVPLTDAGRQAASALRAPLAGRAFSLVLTSPRARARDTAALAGYPAATVDDDLAEWDYGDDEGRTTAEIRHDRPNWFLWDDGVRNGETLEDVAARAKRVIARALAADGDVLVFAHGHVLRVLAACWIEQAPRFGQRLALDPATISVLGWEHDRACITSWNVPAAG
jgi:probable phosphoglycerate mutase